MIENDNFDEDNPARFLLERQRNFVDYWIVTRDVINSSIRAGYSERSAIHSGYRLLRRKDVQKYIAYRQEDTAEAINVSRVSLAMELKKVAFSNIGDLYKDWITLKDFDKIPDEHKSCIKSIDTKIVTNEYGTSEFVKIVMHDKMKSIELLTKLLGYDDRYNNKEDEKSNIQQAQIYLPKEDDADGSEQLVISE